MLQEEGRKVSTSLAGLGMVMGETEGRILPAQGSKSIMPWEQMGPSTLATGGVLRH